MKQQNNFAFENNTGRRFDKEMKDLQKFEEITNITFQNYLENLKNSFITTEKQKLTRIIGKQANMMINALKSGLSFYFKDASIGGIPILDVYVDGKEYDQCIKNLKF